MASRKDEKEQRRQERLAQEQALDAQARRRRLYTLVVGGGLVLAALVAIVVVVSAGGGDGGGGGGDELDVEAVDPPAQRQTDLVKAARAADCRLQNPAIEGRGHTTEKVKYKTNPPNSGNHNPVPAEDGSYGTAPETERLVHELEHGRIILQYDPKAPARRIGQLKGLFDEDPYHLVLTPNATKMPYAVAATAWGHIVGCKKFTDASFDALRAFRERYQDKGPEFVP